MRQDEPEARRASAAVETDEDDDGAGAGSRERRSFKSELDRASASAALALEIAGLKKPTRPLGKKRLLVSGGLSFFLGPIGWLYAAPLKEAIPAILAYVALGWLLKLILPFLLLYLFSIVNIAAAIAGVLYAWGFNTAGKRVPLVLKESDGAETPAATIRKLLSKKKS